MLFHFLFNLSTPLVVYFLHRADTSPEILAYFKETPPSDQFDISNHSGTGGNRALQYLYDSVDSFTPDAHSPFRCRPLSKTIQRSLYHLAHYPIGPLFYRGFRLSTKKFISKIRNHGISSVVSLPLINFFNQIVRLVPFQFPRHTRVDTKTHHRLSR